MYNTNQFMPYYGRQPYYTPSYQQQVQQQPIVQKASELPITDIRFLTADQIKGFIPQLGTKALLVDRDNSMAYIVAADIMGNMYSEPFTFSSLKNAEKKDIPKETQQNFDNFATKEEIESLRKELENLRKSALIIPAKENIKEKQEKPSQAN